MGQVVILFPLKEYHYILQDIGKCLAYRVYNLLFISDHSEYKKRLQARGTLRPLRALLADVLYRILALKRRDKEQYRLFLYCFNKITSKESI